MLSTTYVVVLLPLDAEEHFGKILFPKFSEVSDIIFAKCNWLKAKLDFGFRQSNQKTIN